MSYVPLHKCCCPSLRVSAQAEVRRSAASPSHSICRCGPAIHLSIQIFKFQPLRKTKKFSPKLYFIIFQWKNLLTFRKVVKNQEERPICGNNFQWVLFRQPLFLRITIVRDPWRVTLYIFAFSKQLSISNLQYTKNFALEIYLLYLIIVWRKFSQGLSAKSRNILADLIFISEFPVGIEQSIAGLLQILHLCS